MADSDLHALSRTAPKPGATAHEHGAAAAGSYERIWAVVARIPYGAVATYGQVARLAGRPRQARLVGYALHNLPGDTRIPWHRVVNARGMFSFPVGSEAYRVQRARLRSEDVVIVNERVSLALYGWKPNEQMTSGDGEPS